MHEEYKHLLVTIDKLRHERNKISKHFINIKVVSVIILLTERVVMSGTINQQT